MANTYTKIYIHVVFAVKYRNSLISDSFSEELYKYMAGIIRSKNQFPLMINGMPDHVHLAIAMKPNLPLSDLMRLVKSNSSKWINEKGFLNTRFEWQRGFGAFSFGHSQVQKVVNYIFNQKKHHIKQGFRDEYLAMLKTHKIEYHSDYLFDWISES